MLGGYAGRIGWVDLTGNKVDYRTLEEDTARKFLGGKVSGPISFTKTSNPARIPWLPRTSSFSSRDP